MHRFFYFSFFIIFLFFLVIGGFFQTYGAEKENTYFVVSQERNLCGIFTLGNAKNPNWLMEGWKSVAFISSDKQDFFQQESCQNFDAVKCCRENEYRYAGVSIGISYVQEYRRAAEFLASKKIINKNTLNPENYNFEENISRKEMMKIVANTTKLPQSSCLGSFFDVIDDWGCPYIEAALKNGFIANNNQFRPEDDVTQTEAIKLILKARNIEKRYDTGYWEQDYISTAYYLGFIDQKYTDYNIVATRAWIFQLLARSYGLQYENW